jgi:hypothetical protein
MFECSCKDMGICDFCLVCEQMDRDEELYDERQEQWAEEHPKPKTQFLGQGAVCYVTSYQQGNEQWVEVHETFVAPLAGGYVKNLSTGKQPCTGFHTSGNTLVWSGKGDLKSLIKRHYKK